MRNNFVEALVSLAEKDDKIFLITADLGYRIFDEYIKRFPNQYLNVGIAEQNMIGIATGLALEGRIIFVYSLANFPTLRCLEQIRNDACYHNLNINIAASGCALTYGPLGISHHATEDISILRSLPRMTVVAPGDNWESAEATKALAYCEGVGYLRIDKTTAGFTNKSDEVFRLGKARRILDGNDISLISAGGILAVAIDSAKELSKDGINCRVVSCHTVSSLDHDEIIAAVNDTGGIISVEEHTIHGGLGGAIAEFCLENKAVPEIFYRIGLRDGFTSIVGDQECLRSKYNIDKSAMISKVKELLNR